MESAEVATFWRYIVNSLDRLVACLDGLTPEEVNWRPPAPGANSLYVLAVHTLANAEENLLRTLCGQAVQRDHDAEFRAEAAGPGPLSDTWPRQRERLEQALGALPAAALDADRQHPRRGRITGREVLIVVARHAAEHLGQAELTRDLVRARPAPTPP